MSEIVQHSSKTNEHYTPREYIEAARELMGSIDLDPASCAEANETVKAAKWYGKREDGLSMNWAGNIWLNPPGGKLKFSMNHVTGKMEWKEVPKGPGTSSAFVWYAHLATKWERGEIRSAVFLAFTLEMLRLGQGATIAPQAFPRCYPKDRIKFIEKGGNVGGSPGHANVLIYMPPRNLDSLDSGSRFASIFRKFGLCEFGGNIVV
jgi:hypothetical protein